jgi:NhaP-type Na+/H+ or K+/H+ antiporter
MIAIAIFLIFVYLFSLVSKKAERSIVTGPMVFTLAGILAAFLLPQLTEAEIKNHTILAIAEVTLAIILFSDATRISLRRVMRETMIPARLLGIGMPLAIVAGTLAGVLLLTDLSIWEAAILATILAPTDASLGAAVVKSKLVPGRIRQSLNVEAGLNDGLSVPFLMLFIALSGTMAHESHQPWWLFTVQQIGFGILVGVVVGWLGGKLMNQAENQDWISEEAKQLALISLAVLSWMFAEKFTGGNGFIAAFVAGGMMRMCYDDANQHVAEFHESWGDLLVYFIFYIFGTLAHTEFQFITVSAWMYAGISLTLVRMIPVALSMIGTKLQTSSVLFIGWFGPRGLASVVLGLIYMEEITELGVNQTIIFAVVATVLLSVLAHGVSAVPGTKLYAKSVSDLGSDAPELIPYQK